MNNEIEKRVVVTDINMPFMSMVIFMVKWVIASIPAFIILSILGDKRISIRNSYIRIKFFSESCPRDYGDFFTQ